MRDNVGEQVVACCTLCPWVSNPFQVFDEPNGEWKARSLASVEYHEHFRRHRPLPRFAFVEDEESL